MSCSANPFDAPPALAVTVADCAVLTADTVAANPADVAVAGTVTEAGTVTAWLLLERLTADPPVGADPLNVTVHASVPEPVMEELLQLIALTDGAAEAPAPLRLTAIVEFVEELLAMASCPVTDPAAVGANCAVRTIAWPGFRVAGKVAPLTEKPAPVSVPALILTGAVPVDVNDIDFVTAVFNATLPNDKDVVLALRVGTNGALAFSRRTKVFDVPFALAVRITDWVELTAATVAVKVAVLEPAGTASDDGTDTAVLLLERFTVTLPLVAADESDTVQLSVPAPLRLELWQEIELRLGCVEAPPLDPFP